MFNTNKYYYYYYFQRNIYNVCTPGVNEDICEAPTACIDRQAECVKRSGELMCRCKAGYELNFNTYTCMPGKQRGLNL